MELGGRQFSQLSSFIMPSSPSSFSFSSNLFTFPNYKSPAKHLHLIRAQTLRDDEGNYYNYYYSWKNKKKKNMVDANMSILKERIEEMKKKNNYSDGERAVEKGWNYYEGAGGGYDETCHRRSRVLAETIEIAGFVGTALALVFITGSLFVFLLSLLLLGFPIT